MKIGYARVSTRDQNLDLQLDALRSAGCEKIYQEKISGAKSDRTELRAMIDHLREGDIVVIWKLDRLGRSLKDLVNLVNEIQAKSAGLKFLNGGIDTTTTQGKLTFHIFAALAEYEREITRERTNAGLAAARARGRVGGRRPGLSKENMIKMKAVKRLYATKIPISDICEIVNIKRSTAYKYLNYEEPKSV